MNRKIIFRGWHEDLNIMLYPPNQFDSMILARPHTKITLIDPTTKESKEHFLHASMTWDGRYYVNGRYQNIIWQQFTGLKDSRGKQIFEGDIVKCRENWAISIYEEQTWHIAEVKFEAPSFRLHKADNYRLVFQGCEVVGNIFETPELLK